MTETHDVGAPEPKPIDEQLSVQLKKSPSTSTCRLVGTGGDLSYAG